MSKNQRKLRIGEITINNVQVGAADPAGMNLKENLIEARDRKGNLSEAQRHTR